MLLTIAQSCSFTKLNISAISFLTQSKQAGSLMLSAYPTHSIRHSRGIFGNWMFGLPVVVVAAGILVGAEDLDRVKTVSSLLPGISRPSEPNFAFACQTASSRISGPTAFQMEDTYRLRALAGQARLEHASKQLAHDIKTGRKPE